MIRKMTYSDYYKVHEAEVFASPMQRIHTGNSSLVLCEIICSIKQGQTNFRDRSLHRNITADPHV